jgi:hypothetical protein
MKKLLVSHCPLGKPTLAPQKALELCAMDPGTVKIDLCAIDKSVGLKIDADGRPDHETGEVEIAG